MTSPPLLSDQEFEDLKEVIVRTAGLKISDFKRSLLISRLSPRIKELGLTGFTEYLNLLKSPAHKKVEVGKLINRITTKETRFFRENHHFEFLEKTYLPLIVRSNPSLKKLSFWSAGSATGEEAYSLAMVLSEFRKDHPWIQVRIMATDIDSESLEKAITGLFPESAAIHIPPALLKKYFLKGVKEQNGWIKARSSLRELITFKYYNLHKPGSLSWGPFDGIFCRNVLIYFLPDTREAILKVFYQNLVSQGFLILGHSEHIFDKEDLFRPLGNTIYQKIS
ncbi:MAG: CheR family methyltransferase [Syntrophales bacterium]